MMQWMDAHPYYDIRMLALYRPLCNSKGHLQWQSGLLESVGPPVNPIDLSVLQDRRKFFCRLECNQCS